MTEWGREEVEVEMVGVNVVVDEEWR